MLVEQRAIEERHGFAGALRAAMGGLGGPFEAPHFYQGPSSRGEGIVRAGNSR